MAGTVPATVEATFDGHGWEVHPNFCPALAPDELDKRGGQMPLCQVMTGHGERRHCIHCLATTRISNANHRVDAGSLLGGVPGHLDHTIASVAVLCQAQRRNRPPGC